MTCFQQGVSECRRGGNTHKHPNQHSSCSCQVCQTSDLRLARHTLGVPGPLRVVPRCSQQYACYREIVACAAQELQALDPGTLRHTADAWPRTYETRPAPRLLLAADALANAAAGGALLAAALAWRGLLPGGAPPGAGLTAAAAAAGLHFASCYLRR